MRASILIKISAILILLVGCGSGSEPNNSTKEQNSDFESKIELFDIKPICGPVENQFPVKDTIEGLRDPFHTNFMKDKSLWEVGRLILLDSIVPIDNNITFRIMDSIISKNKNTRDYFYPVFQKITEKADGALSEVIGIYIIKYMRMFPAEFVEKYSCCSNIKRCCETLKYFEDYIAYELMFTNPKIETEKLKSDLKYSDSSKEIKDIFDNFFAAIKDKAVKWHEEEE